MINIYQLNNHQLHGNFIFYKNKGFVFLAPPGSGKSMLSFQLIQKGAKLIADDIIELSTKRQKTDLSVYGQSPQNGFGIMEIFGLGIIKLPLGQIQKSAPIEHIFSHCDKMPRLIEKKSVSLLDIDIPLSCLDFKSPFAADYIDAFCDYPLSSF